jgi:hypothetical protein
LTSRDPRLMAVKRRHLFSGGLQNERQFTWQFRPPAARNRA